MAIKKGNMKGKRAVRAYRHKGTSKVSGYLKAGKDFFPSHAPIWWSYTDDFASDRPGFQKVGDIVRTKLNGEKADFHKNAWDNPEIINNIQVIYDAAVREEQAFIAKYQLNIGEGGWGDLIKAFTILFTSEAAFNRNLQLLNQVKEGDTAIYHNFTALLSSYVQSAARDIIWKRKDQLTKITIDKILPQLNDEIIEQALTNMFKMTDLQLKNGYIETNSDNQKKMPGTEIHAFQDLLNKINLFMNTPFKQLVIDDLGLTSDFLKDTLGVLKRRKTYPSTKKGDKLPVLKSSIKDGNIRGSVQEHFEAIFGSEVGKQLDNMVIGHSSFLSMEIGVKGIKPDVAIHNLTTTAAGKVPNLSSLYSNIGDDSSKRVNAINNAEDFFNKVKQCKGDIIFVSDKNYQIKANDFGGYLAQGNIKLRNLEALLTKVKYPGDFTALLNYLSNSGKGMLLGSGNTGQILSGVATQIGHFLFDDLTITGPIAGGNVNRVHLLNLSGFYVPLSVYMGAILKEAKSTERQMSKLVNTKFVGKGELVTPRGKGWPKGKSEFDTFREHRIQDSYLEIHFMKGVADFITGQFKPNI